MAQKLGCQALALDGDLDSQRRNGQEVERGASLESEQSEQSGVTSDTRSESSGSLYLSPSKRSRP